MATAPSAPYYKQNRLQQLRGFCYAAQAGSISKAAERLFLSQPSVSLQIQALEREFKTTLFERRGPKISLTPDGKTLYELAAPLVEEIDTLGDLFAARRGGVETGRLDIAAGTAVRFEPGQSREVTLVALAGSRTIYGFRGDVMGKLEARRQKS